jgi:hypothetical protein
MQETNVNNFLLLYKNSSKEPYGLRNDFKPDEFLHPPKKDFIADELIHPKVWKSHGESNPASKDENLVS